MDSLFTGNHTRRPTVKLGGSSRTAATLPPHLDLVEHARTLRQQRHLDRTRDAAVRTLQTFYRGRAEATRTRDLLRHAADRLLPADPAAPPPNPADAIAVSRLLALSARLGHRDDIRRLARWARAFLRPPPTATDKVPLLFALFRPELDPQGSWPTLLRMICSLLFIQATTSPSLPQAPLFLEVVKMMCDPASYVKHAVGPPVVPHPESLLRFLLEERDLYSRIARLVLAVDQPTHPTLAPSLALTLLPFRAFPRSTAPSSSTPSPQRARARALHDLAYSFLGAVPDLVLLAAAGGRLAPPQRAALAGPQSALPFWELVESLAAGTSSHDRRDVTGPEGDKLDEEKDEDDDEEDKGSIPPVLLAALAELALAPTTTSTQPGSSAGQQRVSAEKGAVAGAKETREWFDVVRRGLQGLPRGVFAGLAARDGQDKGKAKGKVGATELPPASDGSDAEGDDDDDGGAVERARQAVGALPAVAGDDVMAVRRRAARAPTASAVPLSPATVRSLGLLASPAHLTTLLTLSNRYSASTRPSLARLLTALLARLPASVRQASLHTLLYAPPHAAGLGLPRELYRGWLRAGPLGRRLGGARERSATVLSALLGTREYANSGEWAMLVLVVELYSRTLVTLGDDEFYSASASSAARVGESRARNPLSLDEVIGLSGLARNVAFALYWHASSGDALLGPAGGSGEEYRRTVGGTGCTVEEVREIMTTFLQQVHARDSRRQFTPEGHWLMTSSMDIKHFVETAVYEDERLEAEGDPDAPAPAQVPSPTAHARPTQRGLPDDSEDDGDTDMLAEPISVRPRRDPPRRPHGPARSAPAPTLSKRQLALVSPRLGVLQNVPFVIPFATRVAIFRQFVARDFARLGLGGADNDMSMFRARSARPRAVVRRNHLAEDAFKQLNGLGPQLKQRVEIVFVDEHGMEESGIDGGGLFKELLTSLSKEVFDTDRGLWLATSQNELYPNPHAYAREPNQLAWFAFVGRILGKALYQGILVNVKFAGFFLSKWLGRQAYLDDLASLDPELYRGLVSLKNYSGNVEDLSLNFTITEEDFGVSRTIDLIPQGSEIAVTNENRLQYIVLVSNYRLNVQIAPQCRAFFSGLSEMVQPRWLRLFSQSELAVLVGGTEEAIDVADLRAHTVYSGWSADENTPTIRAFWEVVASFNRDERAKLVRFVTACERPPLLGFGQLNPLFAIRNAGQDESRLPTSATCVNLLKLPEYTDPTNLREKLLYAINSGAGFDLS